MASEKSTEPALSQLIGSFNSDVKMLRGEGKPPETPENPFEGFSSQQTVQHLRTRFAEVQQQVRTARAERLQAQTHKIARPVKEQKEQVDKSDKQRREEITTPVEGKYVVAGRFLEVNTGAPLPDLRVQAMERDPMSDDMLGEVSTDRYGFYRVVYTEEDFHGLYDKQPETFVRVMDEEGNIVYTSDQSFRHKAGAVEVIDGAIEGDEVPESAKKGKQFSESQSEAVERLERQVTYLENRTKLRTDPLSLLDVKEETGDSTRNT